MANKPIHTVPNGGKWQNKVEGGDGGPLFDTKAEAVEAGRAKARRDSAEHIIHNLDGTIGERNSYGNDPHPPKG